MAKQEKFARVGADLRPGHTDNDTLRASRRNRGARTRMAQRGALGTKPIPAFHKKILAFTWLGLLFMAIYVGTIGIALFQPGYSFLDRVTSGLLLFGLSFIVLHGLGYANSMIKALWGYKESRSHLFISSNAPSVTCIVASFNEPAEVLDETVSQLKALDYPNKKIVLLDDSTKEEARQAARDIAEKYGIECVQRTNRRGYKAGAINDYLEQTDSEYLAIFDADALPTSQFLKECIPLIDENPRLGFLQTPQFYANVNQSYVALASARQQNVFYEYIMEGKSYSRAAFCCGTNVIFRRKALMDVGGFDEKSVTEDFATSFNMHYRGWDSLYYNRVFVYSLAPENLAAYFTQQSRWSFGSMGVLRQFIGPFLKNPRAMRAGQWWEYFLSTTYYYVGIVYTLFMILPLLYIFFGVKPLRQDVFTYLAVFIPYFVFTLNMFYAGMEARGYPLSQMILGQQIGFLSFPTHVASAISAAMNKKRPFGVTPKGVGGRLPWGALKWQLFFLVLSLAGFLWGMGRYITGYDRNTTAVVINSFWCLYHVWMLGSIFKLNQPVREGDPNRAFFNDANDANQAARLDALDGVRAPVSLGRVGTLVGAVSLLGVLGVAWSLWSWNTAPAFPVNVYVVDRTYGRDAQEHRSLFWTLNYLKVQKQPNFGPAGGGGRTDYQPRLDYYGFVPAPGAKPEKDPRRPGQFVTFGLDRALPSRLAPPGAVYLADTYGEFSVRDFENGRAQTFRARKRGLDAGEIERIEAFARRGGLLIGEWNILAYPTRPGSYLTRQQMQLALQTARTRLARLRSVDLARAQRALDAAQRGGDFRRISVTRGRLEDVRGRITDAETKLRLLAGDALYNQLQERQALAAQRLERLLGASYGGWYGRYVDDFGEQKQYDPPLYNSVREFLTRKNGRATEPSGPGFVFYPDGPSRVFNPQTGEVEESPFSKPIAILGSEIGKTLTGEIAVIRKSSDPKIASDPLLKRVAEETPARVWFDLVRPTEGARVLANYELQITPVAAQRLRAGGFPARNISPDGKKVVFPACVAVRDGNQSNGELRAIYFAGDVADYPEVSSAAQNYPALGRVEGAISGRFGSFSSQFLWNYYEPILRGAFEETPRIRHQN